MILSHQLEVPAWCVEGFLTASGHFFLILAPQWSLHQWKRLSYKKTILAMSLLLNEVHNGHILNISVFKKTNTMNCTADVQRDFSILLPCIVEYLYKNETISYAGNSIYATIFLQGRIFCFHHFIFRPCFAFLSSCYHKLP